MTPNDIWNKAIPLPKALYRFGRKDKIARLQVLEQEVAVPALMQVALEAIQSDEDRFQKLADGLKDAQSPFAKIRKIKESIQTEMFRALKARKVLAYGYDYPRKASDQAQEVPEELWSSFNDWSKDSLSTNGLRMDAIRLIPINWISKAPSPDPAPKASPGRPSRKDQILTAFEALDQEGKINRGNSMHSHCDLIREWILRHYPDESEQTKGLGDQIIRKTISPVFKKK
ncbi:MAG: hypothetical protein JJ879_14150 [Sneathiella sp.]|uniref:hypothetical protein n=1 Tax=Sneathiella sp. P13V-1 TaxID=2697366 RepID=UPI00187B9D61|nr:hypothetical protein [Sneathiella sp. P13V-1]MBE7638691.1 hypothetical protein [Sneathiella sp. P13V-1]MBO6827344.1 hypothetical protein [Sneathiella sp.]